MSRKFKKSKKPISSDNLQLVAQALGKVRVKFNEKLKFHAASRSEGAAEALYIAATQSEFIEALETCLELRVPYFILGGGTKTIVSSEIKGLTIKNRASAIKVAGVKGKISRDGLGVEEAYVEADSGVTLGKLNEFLEAQKLQPVESMGSLNSTIGGQILFDPVLREVVQSLRVWEDGEVIEMKVDSLRRDQAVISVIFKFKAKNP